eukprot:TRINITY_DN8446_c0_g1_i2.p1 TRINITY_DN8446_c0_g1~~TRINITY_DN8446_c0_g1_i2.p1  ORF type:complete len:332 (+),score=61.51 TRINITY_DN8446_c0_g1_i2:93-998(+)
MAPVTLDQYNGWWIQDQLEGDITPWFVSENVGFVMRQAAWATGYGAGKNKLGFLIHDGIIYSEQDIYMAGRFRGRCKLGGGKTKLDGAIEIVVHDETKTKKLREARRVLSGDGAKLITDAKMFLSDGKELLVRMTHKRMSLPQLSSVECLRWCPVLVHADVPSPGNPELKSAISDPLDSFFPSQDDLLESLKHIFKHKPLAKDETSVSYNEVSDFEFTNDVTKSDGSKFLLRHEFDKESLTWKVGLIIDRIETMKYFMRILSAPLRVEGWCTLPNGDRHSPPAVSAVEDCIGDAQKYFSQQ